MDPVYIQLKRTVSLGERSIPIVIQYTIIYPYVYENKYIYVFIYIYIIIIYISPRAFCFLLHPPRVVDPSVVHLFNGFVGAFGVFFLRTKHCSSLWRWIFPAKFVSVSMNSLPFEEKNIAFMSNLKDLRYIP